MTRVALLAFLLERHVVVIPTHAAGMRRRTTAGTTTTDDATYPAETVANASDSQLYAPLSVMRHGSGGDSISFGLRSLGERFTWPPP